MFGNLIKLLKIYRIEVLRSKSFRNIFIAILLILFSTMAFYSYWFETKVIKERFDKKINQWVDLLNRDIRVNTEVISVLQEHFSIWEAEVDPQKFHTISKSLIKRNSGISALEWLPKITFDQVKTIEQKEHPYGIKFQVREFYDDGSIGKATPREVYYPIYLVEPIVFNEKVLGFDSSSRPETIIAMEKSQNKGRPYASAPITLIQSKTKFASKGVLVYLPLFDGKGTLDINIRGYFLALYRVNDVTQSTLQGVETNGFAIWLYDVTDPKNFDLLFQQRTDIELSDFSFKKELDELSGRHWELKVVAGEKLVLSQRSWYPWMILLAGICLVYLITSYLKIMSSHSYIKKLVKKRTEELQIANEKLMEVSLSDGLTGVRNRRFFDQCLDREWRRAKRNEKMISLILIDIDDFKSFNDTYGHPEGDECLKRVAECINNTANRAGDFVARYGGEEFVVLIDGTTDEALGLAKRLCYKVKEVEIPHKASKTDKFITISAGVSGLTPRLEWKTSQLVEEADLALYEAKHNGKNRVERYKRK
ncbi:MAG: diguanylate cyclase [bacterium]|nr:diguanylate cyclase [bacterium]